MLPAAAARCALARAAAVARAQPAAWQQQQRQSSSSGASSSSPPPQQQQPGAPDAFTASLQAKTEAEVVELLQTARAAAQALAAAAAAQPDAAAAPQDGAGGEDDELVDLVNPDTGEVAGPRGKEPTRYGDWEVKGRATDFA
ncbi:SDHAF4 [Scenedesmus sp. PABB004]|nr:SDHAF4 [Scenedesmus sp. PABB004]